MAPAAGQYRETVGITDHATERTDGGKKSKCRLPESVLKNVVLERKGDQYLDTTSDTIHFLYKATVIVTDYDPEENEWTVVTVYRDPDAAAKRRGHRYREVDVEKVVAETQN